MSAQTVMTKEEFRTLFLQWDSKTSFMSSTRSIRELPEFELLRQQLSLNKAQCLQVLFEELEAQPWTAMMLIHGATRRQAQRVHLPEHICGRLYPILDRYYMYAIGRGYATTKIRVGQASVRLQLRLERDVKDVIRRMPLIETDLACQRAEDQLFAIALHNKERFYHVALRQLHGMRDTKYCRMIALCFSHVMSKLYDPPPDLDLAETTDEIYIAWFRASHFAEQNKET